MVKYKCSAYTWLRSVAAALTHKVNRCSILSLKGIWLGSFGLILVQCLDLLVYVLLRVNQFMPGLLYGSESARDSRSFLFLVGWLLLQSAGKFGVSETTRCMGASISHGMVKKFVLESLFNIDSMIQAKVKNREFGIDSLQILDITPKNGPTTVIQRCFWTPPPTGLGALNVDGSCIDRHIAVGGVVRDHHGNSLGVVAGSVGIGNSFMSEI